MPWPRIATKVTRARPIISAEAVEAVRLVFRIVLSRASTPAVPPIRVAGHPSTEASGRTRRDAFALTPKKRRTMPNPRDPSRLAVESP